MRDDRLYTIVTEGDAQAPSARVEPSEYFLQLPPQEAIVELNAHIKLLEDRLAEFRSRMKLEPTRSEVRRLKEETRDKLLPASLVKSDRNRACFIQSESLLVIDANTDTKAEWFIDQLRICFGQFSCTPLAFNQFPGDLLKRIFLGESLLGFTLGRECRMQDVSDSRSIATWREFELSDPSIRRHIVDGMRLTHLGLGFEEYLTCVLNEDGVFSKLRFLEGDSVDTPDYEDALARLDADFVLLTGTINQMVNSLKKLLGGYASGT